MARCVWPSRQRKLYRADRQAIRLCTPQNVELVVRLMRHGQSLEQEQFDSSVNEAGESRKRSRSVSPWNPFQSARWSASEGRRSNKPGSEVKQDDSAWEILSDRRASFEASKEDHGSLDEDQRIPGAYVQADETSHQRAVKRVRSVKSWKSADNGRALTSSGGSNKAELGEEEVLREFGSGHSTSDQEFDIRPSSSASFATRAKPRQIQKRTSLTRRSYESIKQMTASLSLPLHFRKSSAQFDTTCAQPHRVHHRSNTVNGVHNGTARRSIFSSGLLDGSREHAAIRRPQSTLGFRTPLDDKPNLHEPHHLPLTQHSGTKSILRDEIEELDSIVAEQAAVGVPLRHRESSGLRRASTIRLVENRNRPVSARVSLYDGAPSSSEVSTPMSSNMPPFAQDEEQVGSAAERSPSPPEFSKLPPLRPSMRVEELSGVDFGLETTIEQSQVDEDEAQPGHLTQGGMYPELPPVPPLPQHSSMLQDRASSPQLELPGSFPASDQNPNLATPKPAAKDQAPHLPEFVFGSPMHGVTNDQFSKAGQAVLAEMNKRLMENGVLPIGSEHVTTRHSFKNSGPGNGVGLGRGRGNDKPRVASGGRFDRAHEREFAK